jgi:hypothetical protein
VHDGALWPAASTTARSDLRGNVPLPGNSPRLSAEELWKRLASEILKHTNDDTAQRVMIHVHRIEAYMGEGIQVCLIDLPGQPRRKPMYVWDSVGGFPSPALIVRLMALTNPALAP